MNAVLDANRVDKIFRDCLFRDGEDTSGYIVAEGIQRTVGFHPERLNGHKAEIAAMLDELPDKFKSSTGGGWSFLKFGEDKTGVLWTSSPQRMEQLLHLGIATGKAGYTRPRALWQFMPGAMPYVVVYDG